MIHEPAAPTDEPPFTIEITHIPTKGATFRPTARIIVGSGIRDLAKRVGVHTVGVLAVMTLHVTNNGTIAPTARTLSRAVGAGAFLRLRLHRLARQQWRGQPILRIARTAAGVETYHPSPAVVKRREVLPSPPATPQGVAPAGRPAIVEASRTLYARDRESVEREIMAGMGWPSPEELEENCQAQPKEPTDLNEKWAVQRLVKEKVDFSLAVKLVKEYGPEKVLQQVRWLDQRHAKNRKRFIVGAITHDYLPPTNTTHDAD